MKTFTCSLCFLLFILCSVPVQADEELKPDPPQFKVTLDGYVITKIPVSRVVIKAYDINGKLDTSYNGQPIITGIRLQTRTSEDAKLGAFKNGVLELTSDLAKARKVYVEADSIIVDPENPRKGVLKVEHINGWLSLIPPLIAIILAIWLKNVLIALFAAIWSGATILFEWDMWTGFLRTVDTFLIGELVEGSASGQHTHMQIALFTLFLGAMVGVMSQSGGTLALVNRMKSVTQTRERGQLMTWFLGLIIFFDDYANTLLVGSTMRPVTDRLKISREKLAFIIDSTAAPIAGLAIISTWVGVEVSYIDSAYRELGMVGDSYETFLYTIPFRFYPLHLLVFVVLIAYTGHDFGAMYKAEGRALLKDDPDIPSKTPTEGTDIKETNTESSKEKLPGEDSKNHYARNAIIPLIVLIGAIVIGLITTGRDGLQAENAAIVVQNDYDKIHKAVKDYQPIQLKKESMPNILGAASSNHVMLISSLIASIMAVVMATASRALSLQDSLRAWMDGAKSMFEAVLILTLAWGIAVLCDKEHLNTAGFIIELTDGILSVVWMPALAFILTGLVAFATGSSWATMGLLMPLLISVTFHMILKQEQGIIEAVNPHHTILLGTIGAVLAGAIFGDHCSPISDTTILSSAAAGCDHLDHVKTQLPYAFTVGAISLVFGYIPVGFGISPIITLPLGLGVLLVIVLFIGKPVADYIEQSEPVEEPVQTENGSEEDQNTEENQE